MLLGTKLASDSLWVPAEEFSSGEKLWTADTAMGGKLWRTWNSIAKSLLSDIQKEGVPGAVHNALIRHPCRCRTELLIAGSGHRLASSYRD